MDYLEYVIVIIFYNAVLDTIGLLGFYCEVPYPKSLILANNKTVDS